MKMFDNHTFIVCAFKESLYLEECIVSLLRQSVKSRIIVTTSTPNQYIENICHKFNLSLIINHGEGGIAQDWNFGFKQAKTDLVTIAHQDDVYDLNYCKKIICAYKQSHDPIIIFTGYGELRKNQIVLNNRLLKVKKLLLVPLKASLLQRSVFIRRRILSMGNPICCPSVTYVRGKMPDPLFKVKFKSNVDWQAWEELSRKKGTFVYIPDPLIYHRIHDESTTSKLINDNQRIGEDIEMLCRFWPRPFAKLIEKVYSTSENSNKT